MLKCSNGDAVPDNAVCAVESYITAAKSGLLGARFNLVQLYDLGEAIDQDYASALTWYTRAFDQGMTRAAFQ